MSLCFVVQIANYTGALSCIFTVFFFNLQLYSPGAVSVGMVHVSIRTGDQQRTPPCCL